MSAKAFDDATRRLIVVNTKLGVSMWATSRALGMDLNTLVESIRADEDLVTQVQGAMNEYAAARKSKGLAIEMLDLEQHKHEQKALGR